MSNYIIDPPSMWAGRDEWRAFLRQMEKILRDDPGNADAEHYAEQARDALGE